MKRLVTLLVLAVTLWVGISDHAIAQGAPDSVPGRYIVVLRDGVDPPGFAAGRGARPDVLYEHALKGFAGPLPPALVARLRSDPDVLLIEEDRVFTTFDQPLPAGVNRIDGEENLAAAINRDGGDLDVDIAIIDTGIDTSHPDLRVAGGRNFYRSWFSCVNSGNTSYSDGNGHGTHVAGIAAAKDNTVGAVGVAPGARLWAVRVLGNDGSGLISCIIKGVDWVTANAATIEVANMSLGGGNSPSLCTAIANSAAKGIVYAVAAGNSATDAKDTSPANCSPHVLATSAVADFNGAGGGGAAATCRADVDDTLADFSNFGSYVNIAAPGVCIYSTWKGGSYNTISGTSMASPHVAGAAALYIRQNNLKPATAAGTQAVRDALIANGIPQEGDALCGFAGDTDGVLEPLLYVGTTRTCASPQ